jgi:hypothetical protein
MSTEHIPRPDPHPDGSPFRCPECGSERGDQLLLLNSIYDGVEPWSGVLQALRCAACETWIPRHLGERWGNMTVEEAEREWREQFRGRGMADKGE